MSPARPPSPCAPATPEEPGTPDGRIAEHETAVPAPLDSGVAAPPAAPNDTVPATVPAPAEAQWEVSHDRTLLTTVMSRGDVDTTFLDVAKQLNRAESEVRERYAFLLKRLRQNAAPEM